MSDVKSDWKATFLQVYRRLAHHYGATFLRPAMDDQRSDHAAHWQRFLHTERIRSEEMVAAAEASMSSARFRTYPPNPSEFVSLVHQMRAEKRYGIPDPDMAYQQACGLASPAHPLVQHVRKQIGAWFMRTNADRHIRQRFFDRYQEATEALSRGTLTLEAIQAEQDRAVTAEKTLSADDLSSRFDRLLSGATEATEPAGP